MQFIFIATVFAQDSSALPDGIKAFKPFPETKFCQQFGAIPPVNGVQRKEGGQSCGNTPMGLIPDVNQMYSSLITSPRDQGEFDASVNNTIKVDIANLEAGFFNNPNKDYYLVPQPLNKLGQIQGHVHITMQKLDGGVPDPTKFAFFKGVNDKGKGPQGRLLEATVNANFIKEDGLYRICTLSGSDGHQPAIAPVLQRGPADDCIRVTVKNAGQNNNAQQGKKGDFKANDFECIDDTRFRHYTNNQGDFVIQSCAVAGLCATRTPPSKNPCIGKERAAEIDGSSSDSEVNKPNKQSVQDGGVKKDAQGEKQDGNVTKNEKAKINGGNVNQNDNAKKNESKQNEGAKKDESKQNQDAKKNESKQNQDVKKNEDEDATKNESKQNEGEDAKQNQDAKNEDAKKMDSKQNQDAKKNEGEDPKKNESKQNDNAKKNEDAKKNESKQNEGEDPKKNESKQEDAKKNQDDDSKTNEQDSKKMEKTES